MLAAVVFAALLVSCQSNKTNPNESEPVNSSSTVTNAVYEGILPAADGPGIRYQLTIENLKDGKGTYQLNMTYLKDDKENGETFTSKGELEVSESVDKHSGKEVYILNPDDGSDVIYFIVKDSKTLRMLDKEMQEIASATGLNYDIFIVEL